MLTIAYLINQYPKLSHSFIRREIAAVEAQGVRVERVTVRRSGESMCEPADCAEAERTRVLLDRGVLGLVAPTLLTLIAHPIAFVSALLLARRVGWQSERGFLCHLIYLMEACALRRYLVARSIPHVHAHFGTNAATVAMLCRALNGPTYSVTVHGCEEFDKPEFIALAEKVNGAEFVATVSQFGRSQVCRWSDARQWSKVHVVHCGVDPSFLNEPATDVPTAPRFVSVGRLCKEKGQLCMIEAARLLRDRGATFTLDLIGEGELRGLLEAAIDQSGLQGIVNLLGAKSGAQVREQILSSRTLILSSFAENLPVTLMEAMALRRPVIATRIAGIPELVREGETGWLVTPGSAEELADAMQRALEATAAKLMQMGEEGAKRVRANHDVAHEATLLVRLFRDVTEGPVAAAPLAISSGAAPVVLERRSA